MCYANVSLLQTLKTLNYSLSSLYSVVESYQFALNTIKWVLFPCREGGGGLGNLVAQKYSDVKSFGNSSQIRKHRNEYLVSLDFTFCRPSLSFDLQFDPELLKQEFILLLPKQTVMLEWGGVFQRLLPISSLLPAFNWELAFPGDNMRRNLW